MSLCELILVTHQSVFRETAGRIVWRDLEKDRKRRVQCPSWEVRSHERSIGFVLARRRVVYVMLSRRAGYIRRVVQMITGDSFVRVAKPESQSQGDVQDGK